MRLFFIYSIYIFYHHFAYSQVYNLTRYSTDDGLAQSQVRSMLQDQKGYLWLGTRGGISRFDGREFTNFTSQRNQGLVGDFITALYEDQEGDIWIGSERGLSKFDGRSFSNFMEVQGLIDDNVLSITSDGGGNLWIGQEGGVVIYDGESFKAKLLEKQASVNCLQYDSSNNQIWIGTNLGLYVCDADSMNFAEHSPFLANVTIYHLLKDQSGKLWVGTDEGIYVYQDNNQFTHYTTADGLTHNTVYTLGEDHHGHIWAGMSRGVAYYGENGWTELRFNRRSLPNVRSLLIDIEGNIWLGLDGGGIRKLTGGVFQTYNVDNGLSSNIAKSFLEDDEGQIWLSTYDNGLNIYRDENFTPIEAKGMAGNDISYSFKDTKGQLWFATYSHGLSKYSNGRFKTYFTAQGLKSDSVYCVTEDYQGRIWVGTEHGISIFDGKSFYMGYTTRDGLIDNTVYSIYEDAKRNIWIGTPEGVSRITDGTFTNFAYPGLGHTVISILEDQRENLWFATSEGLYLFMGGDRFQKIKISEAEGAHDVVSLINEGRDYLWVGTENGAYRLNLTTFDPTVRNRFEHYTQKDGLPSLECNGNAAFLDSKGNIWIGTTEGAIMRPAHTHRIENELPPMLHITGVRLSFSMTDWTSKGFELDKKTGLPINMRLPYDENRLDFDFIGISLKSPKQVEYKFMLEGLDNEWSGETRQHSFSYTNLHPGTYTFKVISKKESTAWDYEHPTTFTFQILHPWYTKWWFVLIMSLLVIGVSWAIYRKITLDRHHRREEERMKNTAEKLRLEHQALYAMMNPHFTFNALQSIQYFIHRQDRISANKFLSSFAKLMRKNLESTQSEFISLNEEIERLKIYLSLEQMRFPEKFEYKVEVAEEVDPYDIQLPPMILQPFVENSIKHGIMPLEAEGEILVDISKKDDDHLWIKIQDNGIGINESKRKKASRPSDHVSKGMQITMDRLALFAKMTGKKYSVDIGEIKDNGKITGTLVKLLLPLYQ